MPKCRPFQKIVCNYPFIPTTSHSFVVIVDRFKVIARFFIVGSFLHCKQFEMELFTFLNKYLITFIDLLVIKLQKINEQRFGHGDVNMGSRV